MENKFTRGIQERQQRAQMVEPDAPTVPHMETQDAENTTKNFPELEDYIEKTPSRKAKNKTLYLDGNVLDALKKAAQKQQIAESKLVNDILKKVLLSSQGD